jgi:lipoate-protein ligase B
LGSSEAIQFRSIPGLTAYAAAREVQLELVEKRVRGEIPDTVLLLEHEPVVTRGRGLQWTGVARERAMPLGPLPPGIAFSETERGGDLTYHGPGQLVIYPIIKLDGSQPWAPYHDVAAFLRRFEQLVIEELRALGLAQAGARENATGVWVGDHKIASMGIAVRKWVTFHGMAINVVNDLAPFHLMSPCGYAPEVMTRLKDLDPTLPEAWRPWLEGRLARRWWSGSTIEVQIPV